MILPTGTWELYLLDIDAMTSTAEYETSTHCFGESPCLQADLFLVLLRKIHKMIIFRANEKRYSSLVEASALTIPLLDTVKR